MRPDPDACRDPDLLAAEVRRLQAVIDAGECPHVTGTVTRYCTLTPFTLTDEEREAVEYVVVEGRVASSLDRDVLRGLLERTRATGSV